VIAKVHDGIERFCGARGYASVDDIPRYLPRD
jgi:hypothetical protein